MSDVTMADCFVVIGDESGDIYVDRPMSEADLDSLNRERLVERAEPLRFEIHRLIATQDDESDEELASTIWTMLLAALTGEEEE